METRNKTCTYSFGDNGTTATVSPSGRLLRMSQHFRGEKVGYCVDHPSIPQPYAVVDRITPFLSSANDPDHNIGFYPDLGWLGYGVDSAPATFIDNRWPVFTIHGDNGKVEIEYSISNGTVYQTFHFVRGQPLMALMTDLLIRQLEFADSNNSFNKAEKNDDAYNTELLSPKGNHIKRWHDREDDNKHVALFISAYIGTAALSFRRDLQNSGQNDCQAFCMVWPDGMTSGPVKITFVYALELINDESPKFTSNTVHFPVPRKLPEIHMADKPGFTKSCHLNHLLRRNLEHILSVCSIPVYTDTSDDNNPAIALTCGEVDDHRVATAASFYCFQLLLMALKHFESLPKHTEHKGAEAERCYSCSMVKRIRRVLNGHLKWIFGSEYRDLAGNTKCPHTWVNGKEIAGWEKSLYFPPESLVDVPFQLIKAGDFYKYDKSCGVPETAGQAVKAWIKDLDTKNKLGCYAFPRNMKASIHQFYLTDHVLIWRAMKSAEEAADQSVEGGQSRKSPGKRYYWSSNVQGQILKRFTAENPVSKKRMLSVSRSPSHIRFLLRNKDASLFHAMDSGLFDKPGATAAAAEDVWFNKLDIWKNLVDCQRLHEDNDDTSWDEPLRFALSMMMAQKGKAMNSLSPSEMHGRATSVLLGSVWPNDLFPGQLDVNSEPAIYTDEWKRDTYWGSTFEIPYILWKHAQPPAEPRIAAIPGEPQSSPVTTLNPEFWISFRTLMENQANGNITNKPKTGPMKASFPWNNVVDQTNIVQLSDEWLYNVPEFFKKGCEEANLVKITQALDNVALTLYGPNLWDKDVKGAVINVPRSKAGKKAPPKLEALCQFAHNRGHLSGLMQERRLPTKSKKRLCASFSANRFKHRPYPQIGGESEAMVIFFSKHVSYDKSFFEYTTAENNRWTTEFHLSFYSLHQPWSRRYPRDLVSISSPGEHAVDQVLVKVAMGWRFDGDFFDRYWTVHFLETNPHRDWEKDDIESIVKNMLRNQREEGVMDSTTLDFNALGDNKEPWRQRRILELLLFQRMTDRMRKDTVEILNDARSNVWKLPTEEDARGAISGTEGSSMRPRPRRTYLFQQVSQRCQLYQQILQAVEQDIAENLAKIELWLSRERDRQNERPRWTFNDEIKYRSIISKLLIQNDHSIQDLRRNHGNISQFNEVLTRELERIRNEVDQRREDNIKRFTYVTVIFLPLSFGTGVFSMSEAPAGDTLESMIKTSAAAFGATVILLAFSGQLELLFRKAREMLYRFAGLLSYLYKYKVRLSVSKLSWFFQRVWERFCLFCTSLGDQWTLKRKRQEETSMAAGVSRGEQEPAGV